MSEARENVHVVHACSVLPGHFAELSDRQAEHQTLATCGQQLRLRIFPEESSVASTTAGNSAGLVGRTESLTGLGDQPGSLLGSGIYPLFTWTLVLVVFQPRTSESGAG